MTKVTVNHWSAMKAVLLLAMLPTLPLFAQEIAQLPPTAAPAQQEGQTAS